MYIYVELHSPFKSNSRNNDSEEEEERDSQFGNAKDLKKYDGKHQQQRLNKTSMLLT